MRVAQATRFGGPEVLVASEAPDPAAGPGQVVVGVSVADVLFLETQLRSGWGGEYFAVEPPYVPGDGVAGEVISIGEGADPNWVGRHVVDRTSELDGYAERAVVPAEGLIQVPDELGLPEAAALLHNGPTALGLFENAGVRPQEWVLVTAAGGGLGILLVQLARAAGARVLAAARGGRKLDLSRELGAKVVVDYSEPGWPERVREANGGAGPQVVFDGVGGKIGGAAFGVTARGGRFSTHGAPRGAPPPAGRSRRSRRWARRARDQAGAVRARGREAAGRAGAVGGGGGQDKASYWANLSLGTGRRGARRDGGPPRRRKTLLLI